MEKQQLPEVVELNVGGTNMASLLTTLTKERDSKLAAMFSGREEIKKDLEDRYFLDCNAEIFKLILEYLRLGRLPEEQKAVAVYELADYFGLNTLKKELSNYNVVRNRIKLNGIKDNSRYIQLRDAVFAKLEGRHSFENCIIEIGNDSSGGRYSYMDNQHNYVVPVAQKWRKLCCSNVAISEDFIWCLVEELQTYGYGKYIYTVYPTGSAYDMRIERCSRCPNYHVCSILLSNHLIKDY